MSTSFNANNVTTKFHTIHGNEIVSFEHPNMFDARVLYNKTNESAGVLVPNLYGFEYSFDLSQLDTCTLDDADTLDFLKYMAETLTPKN